MSVILKKKNNPRITSKDRGLIKGALRRVFSRSDLRKTALDASRIEHSDPERPRVTKWSRCPHCQTPTATYQMEVDHISPVIPIDTTLALMSLDELADRIWCDKNNLVAICKPCHILKTKAERKARKPKKEKKR